MRGSRDVCKTDIILSSYFGDKRDRENVIALRQLADRKHFRDFIHPVKLIRAFGAVVARLLYTQ